MDNVYKAYKAPETTQGNGLYHKFEDGVTYTFRLLSEPVVYEATFSKGDETSVSTKYGWVVWNIEQKIAQVLQLPLTAYRTIAAYASDDEYGDPQKYNIKITRTGTGPETKYEIIPSPKQIDIEDIAPEALEAVKKVDLIEAISSGKGVDHVFWLKDVINKPPRKADIVLEETEENKISLDEIPF